MTKNETKAVIVKEISHQKISASLEDYLEVIYEKIKQNQQVKAIEIAKKLQIGRSSVSEALKNLAAKKLINYSRYGTISLTQSGEKIAQNISKKHQILFEFFNKKLGLNSEQSELNACRVEHVITGEAFEKFIQYMKM